MLYIDRGLSRDLILSALSYEPATGQFFWTTRRNSHSKVGKIAGRIDNYGYRIVGLYGVQRPAHRLAWAILHDEFPDCEIDHINGDRSDNRACNLRLAERSQQAMNRKVRCDSQSGTKGVRYDGKKCHWVSRISLRGRRVIIGRFQSLNDAAAAYDMASELLFGAFASNGGKYAEDVSGHVMRAVDRLRKHASTID